MAEARTQSSRFAARWRRTGSPFPAAGENHILRVERGDPEVIARHAKCLRFWLRNAASFGQLRLRPDRSAQSQDQRRKEESSHLSNRGHRNASNKKTYPVFPRALCVEDFSPTEYISTNPDPSQYPSTSSAHNRHR